MVEYNKNLISQRLDYMSESQRVAFAASCCERLLPNYKKFVEVDNWGDYNSLRRILNRIWNHASGQIISNDEIRQFLKICYDVVPNSDDFTSMYTSYAIDAGASLYNTLKYCLEGDIKCLTSVVDASINTVDLFIQEKYNICPSDPNLEQKITSEKLMQTELKKQLEDLNLIENHLIIDEQFLTSFRSPLEGKSNIELA